ncbi:hypothetical protein [Natronococcus pandeyae]|nr:hypothetical protein [Natronococcus pandeyae]
MDRVTVRVDDTVSNVWDDRTVSVDGREQFLERTFGSIRFA